MPGTSTGPLKVMVVFRFRSSAMALGTTNSPAANRHTTARHFVKNFICYLLSGTWLTAARSAQRRVALRSIRYSGKQCWSELTINQHNFALSQYMQIILAGLLGTQKCQ